MSERSAVSLAEAFGVSERIDQAPEPAALTSPPAARPPGQAYRSLRLPDEGEEAIGAATALRRRREDRDLATPSALIRRAMAEWPDRCAKVAAIAARMGEPVGRVWQRVIDAGVLALDDDLAEDGL